MNHMFVLDSIDEIRIVESKDGHAVLVTLYVMDNTCCTISIPYGDLLDCVAEQLMLYSLQDRSHFDDDDHKTPEPF